LKETNIVGGEYRLLLAGVFQIFLFF